MPPARPRVPLLCSLACSACPAWWSPSGAIDDALSDGGTSTGTDTGTGSDTSPTDGGSTGVADSDDTGTTAVSVDGVETWCRNFDPAEVYVLGTFLPGENYRGVLARPAHPHGGCVGFSTDPMRVRLRADGKVLWTLDQGGVRVFTPDPHLWNDALGGWHYPAWEDDPNGNDELLATPACGDGGVEEMLVHPGDHSLIYSCGGIMDPDVWYDQNGDVVFDSGQDRPLALAVDGTLLTDAPRLVPPGGAPLAVVPPAMTGSFGALAARSKDDGFWVAVKQSDQATAELWFVDLAGVATRDGEYAAFSDGGPWDPPYPGEVALAGDGALVYWRYSNTDRVIIRVELSPGDSQVVYTDADAPEYSWPTDPQPFVYLWTSPQLFTGP